MWQQEQPEDGGVGDLVVKGLTVEVKERGVDTDVVSDGRGRAGGSKLSHLMPTSDVCVVYILTDVRTQLKEMWEGLCCWYLPLGVRHCSSLKTHTASPVAWITSALDNTL